jgi:hypothetical protein
MFRPVCCCQCLCIILSWLPLSFSPCFVLCLVASVSVLSYLDCPHSFSPCFVLCLVASVSVLSYLDCPLVFLHVSSCVLLPVSLYYAILTALFFLCRVICVVCLFVSSCVLLPVSLYYPILTALSFFTMFRPVSCCQCLCIIISWLPLSFYPTFIIHIYKVPLFLMICIFICSRKQLGQSQTSICWNKSYKWFSWHHRQGIPEVNQVIQLIQRETILT